MENPLTKLALDHWYKVVMATGISVFLLTGAGLLPEFPTAATAFISIGSFLVGLGEWINHPLQTGIIPRTYDHPALMGEGYPRRNRPIGMFFVIMGMVIIAIGFYKVLG